jgi:hypothetical protein
MAFIQAMAIGQGHNAHLVIKFHWVDGFDNMLQNCWLFYSISYCRIERLWREVWSGCVSFYYQLFNFMEEQSILNVNAESHMQALHMVFKEKIQGTLDTFARGLLRRPIRSEHHKTPLQLWIRGQTLDPHWEPQNEVIVKSSCQLLIFVSPVIPNYLNISTY